MLTCKFTAVVAAPATPLGSQPRHQVPSICSQTAACFLTRLRCGECVAAAGTAAAARTAAVACIRFDEHLNHAIAQALHA